MGVFPDFFSSSLALEKCLQPKNPRWADNGDGCTACRTWCRFYKPRVPKVRYRDNKKMRSKVCALKQWRPTLLIAAPFFCAYDPHSMKTRPSKLLLSQCTTASVKVSQPLSLWELAWCARTVNTALSNNTPDHYSDTWRRGHVKCQHTTYGVSVSKHSTDPYYYIPCLAHPVRSPCPGCSNPSISETNSLYMFPKLKVKRKMWQTYKNPYYELVWNKPKWLVHRGKQQEEYAVIQNSGTVQRGTKAQNKIRHRNVKRGAHTN